MACGEKWSVWARDWRGRFLVRAGVGARVSLPLIGGGDSAVKLWFGSGAYIV